MLYGTHIWHACGARASDGRRFACTEGFEYSFIRCGMYVCLFVCMYACLSACILVCMYVHIERFEYSFVCCGMHVCLFVCMYTCLYVCALKDLNIICMLRYVCTPVGMYVFICSSERFEYSFACCGMYVHLLAYMRSHAPLLYVFFYVPSEIRGLFI
jgi:hypothetical protein